VRRVIACIAVAMLLVTAAGRAAETSSRTALDSFLQGLQTLRADFRQTVVDARGRRIDESRGRLVVVRPGKFRWEIAPQAGGQASDQDTGRNAGHAVGPGARQGAGPGSGAGSGQLLVADGRNLWFLDRDLEQVNVKPMDAGLSATPAMLLSGVADVRSAFDVVPDGSRDGLDWVRVTPKRADADFRDAALGFARGELRRMVLRDKLGQTATVSFDRVERNVSVSPDEVRFTPPPGADVIGTPKP